jgi:hypothetical protein
MKSATTRSAKILLTKVVSLLTLAGLLVAPACPSLCAAQHCARAGVKPASEGHCQAAASIHQNVQQIYAAQKCNLPEMPPATVTSGNTNDDSRASRAAVASAAGSYCYQEWPRISSINIKARCSSPPAIAHSDLHSAASILRI